MRSRLPNCVGRCIDDRVAARPPSRCARLPAATRVQHLANIAQGSAQTMAVSRLMCRNHNKVAKDSGEWERRHSGLERSRAHPGPTKPALRRVRRISRPFQFVVRHRRLGGPSLTRPMPTTSLAVFERVSASSLPPPHMCKPPTSVCFGRTRHLTSGRRLATRTYLRIKRRVSRRRKASVVLNSTVLRHKRLTTFPSPTHTFSLSRISSARFDKHKQWQVVTKQ